MRKLLPLMAALLLVPTALPAQDLSETWQGTLVPAPGIRTVIRVNKPVDGIATGTMYRVDQDGGPIPVTFITPQGSTVRFSIDSLDATYIGQLSADGASIHGTWTQASNAHPFNLVRTTPQTAWAVPPPPTGPKQMPPPPNPVLKSPPSSPTIPPSIRT